MSRSGAFVFSFAAFCCLLAIAALTLFDLAGYGGNLSRAGLVAVLLILTLAAIAGLVVARRIVEREKRDAETEEQQARADLRRDATTGALLRRFFLESCEARLRENGVENVPSLAYVAIDMDYLKLLNDTFGHEAGDGALRRVVEAVRASLPRDGLIGRLGGDEFAAMFSCETPEEACEVAEAILGQIRRPTMILGRELSLSASLGVTLLPMHTRLLSEALQFSDLALYEGKKAGRDRSTLFTPSMFVEFQQERQIERELRIGIGRKELRQLYLPVVDAKGHIVAARALMEWNSRWLGPVPRETFLRIAKTSDLIHRLGETKLAQACEDLARLPDIAVAVEVYPGQLKRDDVVETFKRCIERSGIDPWRLIATVGSDVTDMSAQDSVKRRLQEIRALGVRITLDDFGPVAFDLQRLRDFPVDFVRIPARQIQHLGESEIDNALVGALVSVAAAMGLTTTADGVTRGEQVLLARTVGCSLFCGPYFSGPLTAEALEEQLLESGTARLPRAEL